MHLKFSDMREYFFYIFTRVTSWSSLNFTRSLCVITMRVCVSCSRMVWLRLKASRVKTYLCAITICSHQSNYRQRSICIHDVTDGSLVTHLFRLSAEQEGRFPPLGAPLIWAEVVRPTTIFCVSLTPFSCIYLFIYLKLTTEGPKGLLYCRKRNTQIYAVQKMYKRKKTKQT